MILSSTVLSAIKDHAARELPHEACGYLAERNGVIEQHYEMTNMDRAADHFSMDPKEQFAAVKEMRRLGQTLAAVYHSHPETPARPSREDIRLAYDPDISHVIISMLNPDDISVKAFIIHGKEVRPDPITIAQAAERAE